jgi:A/G-specific adenine glycosylase
VRRRSVEGFLGGLWEFPTVCVGEDEAVERTINRLTDDLALRGDPQPLGRVKHVYSHFRLDLHLYRLSVERAEGAGDGRWLAVDELTRLALHGAHKKALDYLMKTGE